MKKTFLKVRREATNSHNGVDEWFATFKNPSPFLMNITVSCYALNVAGNFVKHYDETPKVRIMVTEAMLFSSHT